MSQRFSDAELAAEMYYLVFHESECEIRARKAYDGGSEAVGEHYRKLNIEYARQATIMGRIAYADHAHDPEPKTVYVYDATGRCIGTFPKPDTWTE